MGQEHIKDEGFDTKKALAYIAMNKNLTTDLNEIEHLLPTRKSGRSTDSMGKHEELSKSLEEAS